MPSARTCWGGALHGKLARSNGSLAPLYKKIVLLPLVEARVLVALIVGALAVFTIALRLLV
eukprot:4718954-Prymnesium_polylepis.1